MKIPFTILTGFLGAGKTTILNRVLAAEQDRRIAVLVNELGRVAIDTKLITYRGGDVLELAGGCVCCKIDVKNDLWDGIADVARRSAPDAIILETTGIAEPPAILERLPEIPEELGIVPAGVVAVVDVEGGGWALERREEARVQVECADRVLLSKLDLAPADALENAHRRLAELNPAAERASFPVGQAETRALTDWLLEIRARGPAPKARAAHRHGQLVAASYVDSAPLVEAELLRVVDEFRDCLLRVKGYAHVAGQERRGFLELSGQRVALSFGEPWGDDPPKSEIVFIGEGLDEPALQRRLWACRVPTEDC